MNKGNLLYTGKAKDVYETDREGIYMLSYRDDLTALNGGKKGSFSGKGAINNQISNLIFKKLESKGVPTHFVAEISPVETAVKQVDIIPLEVIVRNIAAGSFSKKYGVPEGKPLACPVLEFSLKDDSLGDPMISESHILALSLATKEEMDTISRLAFMVNDTLIEIFQAIGVTLVDFKIEFGRALDGQVLLSDEISPDSCRLWDTKTGDKMDKDLFRRDLGGYEGAYREILRRLSGE